MLDFSKLLPQLDGLSASAVREELADKIAMAGETLFDAGSHFEDFQQRLLESEGRSFWNLASPLEPLDTVVPLLPNQRSCSVVAVDGSQIMPTHHEVHSCYLINIGRAVISYGTQLPVILDSTPHLFHKVEDLNPLIDRRRWHADDNLISLERNLLELSTLRDTALSATKRALPVVALVDGSLETWSLERMPDHYQQQYWQRLKLLLDSFKHHRIPILGYISHSRSVEIVNSLRIWNCPYLQIDCHKLCGHLQEDEYPCSKFWPVTDRQMMAQTLPVFHRGPLFVSGSNRNQPWRRDHAVCFTYVNIGKEVARIEFPRWLLDDIPLLYLGIETAIAQSQKGDGYPVCLAEAHHQAVVRSADRTRFFEILSNQLVALGVPKVRVSPKEKGKRRGIV